MGQRISSTICNFYPCIYVSLTFCKRCCARPLLHTQRSRLSNLATAQPQYVNPATEVTTGTDRACDLWHPASAAAQQQTEMLRAQQSSVAASGGPHLQRCRSMLCLASKTTRGTSQPGSSRVSAAGTSKTVSSRSPQPAPAAQEAPRKGMQVGDHLLVESVGLLRPPRIPCGRC